MKYPITGSITFVQISASTPVHAWVSIRTEDGKVQSISTEMDLGNLSDATDIHMWAQMAAASVCDAL